MSIEGKKVCSKCGREALVLLRSQFVTICADCGHNDAWGLSAGQRPLIGPSRRLKSSPEATKND